MKKNIYKNKILARRGQLEKIGIIFFPNFTVDVQNLLINEC
jgi:hypothetical protein